MYGAFKAELDLPRTNVNFTYLILSQPRTGSTMICSALASSGIAGVPIEYFNAAHLRALSDPLDLAVVLEYYEEAVSRRTTNNGVFGMKLHYDQFEPLFVRGDTVTESGGSFLKSFDRIILTSRRDKLAQAFSELVALRTDHWNSEDDLDEGKQNYDFDRKDIPDILYFLSRAVSGETAWNDICKNLELKPHRVAYEDLSKSPQTELKKVVQHLGLPVEDIAPLTVKMSRDSNWDAKKSFLKALGADIYDFARPPVP